MDSKLTLYDILAVVIPGGVLLIGIGFLVLFHGAEISGSVIAGLTGTTVFLVVAYFLGQVIQGLGKWYETTWLIWRWNGMPSARFLRPNDNHYSASMKVLLWDAILSRFKMDLPKQGDHSKETDRLRQEAFNLCYSHVIDRDAAKLAPVMNATYGLFRGLVVVSILSMLMFGLAGWDMVTKKGLIQAMPLISLAALFAFFAVLFSARTKQRGEIFADNIFRSFLNANGKPDPGGIQI